MIDAILRIESSPYYRDGALSNKPLFALYDVIADCFLVVLSNEKVITHLKYILSSRYHLHICRIDTASNYGYGMITNADCERWSMTNRDAIRFSDPISNTITAVDTLCATREVAQYDVFGEKIWGLFCAHCLYIVENEYDVSADPTQRFNNSYWQYSKLDDYLNSFLNISQVDYPRPNRVTPQIKNAVLNILYLERDFQSAEAEIKQLIKL